MTREDPAAEAWSLLFRFFFANKPRMVALAQEFELTLMQLNALRQLEPGRELAMSALAEALVCDPSYVTGIVDRLEARGLIERRGAPRDRRVKMLSVTEEGERVREIVIARMAEPPPALARLPRAEQRALRDALRRAMEYQEAAADVEPRPAAAPTA